MLLIATQSVSGAEVNGNRVERCDQTCRVWTCLASLFRPLQLAVGRGQSIQAEFRGTDSSLGYIIDTRGNVPSTEVQEYPDLQKLSHAEIRLQSRTTQSHNTQNRNKV